jgi:hypothetical protein
MFDELAGRKVTLIACRWTGETAIAKEHTSMAEAYR